jgi:hypothetical protein
LGAARLAIAIRSSAETTASPEFAAGLAVASVFATAVGKNVVFARGDRLWRLGLNEKVHDPST